MANEVLLELFRQHRTSYDKYTYFLMAVAASAVAFAIQKTDGLALSWSHALLGLSVSSFGISFWCGARALIRNMVATKANYEMLKLERGLRENQPTSPEATKAAMQETLHIASDNIEKGGRWATWQNRTLLLGGLAFVAWQVLQMHLVAASACP